MAQMDWDETLGAIKFGLLLTHVGLDAAVLLQLKCPDCDDSVITVRVIPQRTDPTTHTTRKPKLRPPYVAS